ITDIVQTDLAALGVVARFVMHFRLVRDRADVPALLDEFSRVLWEELDYRKEADNALRFNSMFADDLGIYVPGVYLEHTTHLVLTLEDVTAIKINDYAALDAAGINRLDVARRLLDCYLEQIFDYGFFHADPHPGNLFVYPLPESGEAALSKNGQNGTNGANGAKNGGRNGVSKPFYLIFVDFGMTGRVTPDIMAGLRDTLIAVITQDARGMVESYQKLGVLMPGADTARLEAATRAVFDKVWGLNMNELASLPFDEVTDVAREFSDLLLAMPFQMPQDFIYLGRTVAILSGMCTGLDPRFDPWKEIQPFVERILRQDGAKAAEGSNLLERLRGGPAGLLIDTALQTARRTFARAYRLPSLAESVLDRAERGDLVVRIDPSSELDKRVRRIERTVSHISTGILLAAVILSTTMLYLAGERTLAAIGFGVAAVLMLIYLFRGRG
ncbi:MAG: AarF/ABC1/UbiB kinase family protein, partial [Anaerolineae bacterium]|nr:AarF/ABC1/UbiB kinase family protein [Anaerolineae bacterium]